MVLDEYFDYVVLISLREQVERRERALRALRDGGLSERVRIFDAVKGAAVKRPAWWPNGSGAWGCYRSHVAVLREAQAEGAQAVLVLEDDVVWSAAAAAEVRRMMAEMPDDWAQIYLGGQHRWEPQRLRGVKSVLRGRSVHRTHAYALRGGAIEKVLEHLERVEDFAAAKAKGEKRHVDHHLEGAHRAKAWPVYAPVRWMAGQGEAYSTILGKKKQEEWWQPRKILEAEREKIVNKKRETSDVPFVIFSTPRSGSTLLMRMLNGLDGVACNGERRDFLWSLKGLYEHRAGLEAKSAHSFEELDAVVARGEFPSHHNGSTAEGWAAACEATLRAWCGGEGERGAKAWGMKEVHIGKAGGQYLFQICDWLQGMIPGVRFIFLTRELEKALVSVLGNAKWWIPSYASCAAGCERALKTQQAAMRDYAALYPSACVELGYEDLLDFMKVREKLGMVGICIDEAAWEKAVAVKI